MGSLKQPPFERIAIVGIGLIGGSIALAVKRRWPSVRIAAIDRPHIVQRAIAGGAADEGGDRLALADGASLIVLAAPVLQNIAAIEALPSEVRGAALVTDVGSTKRLTMEAAASLPERLVFAGGHPLAGAAVGGLDAARFDLFESRPWIVTPPPQECSQLDALFRFITALGAIPQRMNAADHDRLVAYVSHLPQLTVSALMHVVGGHAGEDGLAFAGRGLRDTTRLASSPAATWRDIVSTNGDNISAALDELILTLQRLKASGDSAAIIDDVFLSAARWKGLLDGS